MAWTRSHIHHSRLMMMRLRSDFSYRWISVLSQLLLILLLALQNLASLSTITSESTHLITWILFGWCLCWMQNNGYFYSASSSPILFRSTLNFRVNTPKRYRQTTSEGLTQGPYMAAGVGFEPATLQPQGTGLTTEPPCSVWCINDRVLLEIYVYNTMHQCLAYFYMIWSSHYSTMVRLIIYLYFYWKSFLSKICTTVWLSSAFYAIWSMWVFQFDLEFWEM